jgi:hypothetical protein
VIWPPITRVRTTARKSTLSSCALRSVSNDRNTGPDQNVGTATWFGDMRRAVPVLSAILKRQIASGALYQAGLMYPRRGKRAEVRSPVPTARARTTAESIVEAHFGSRRPFSASSLVS